MHLTRRLINNKKWRKISFQIKANHLSLNQKLAQRYLRCRSAIGTRCSGKGKKVEEHMSKQSWRYAKVRKPSLHVIVQGCNAGRSLRFSSKNIKDLRLTSGDIVISFERDENMNLLVLMLVWAPKERVFIWNGSIRKCLSLETWDSSEG